MPPPASPDAGALAAGSLRAPVLAAAAGLAAYALSLLATLPARFVVSGHDAAGTVWHGSATLGGATAAWNASLPESLASGNLAARWTLDGPATLLTGLARWRPFAATELTAVRGRAAWGLLAAAVPGLPADCTVPLDVALDRVAARDLRGTVRSLPGTCGTAPVRAIPRLIVTFDGTTGRITPWTDRSATLATVAITGSAVHLHITPVGAGVLPGPARAGDLDIGR